MQTKNLRCQWGREKNVGSAGAGYSDVHGWDAVELLSASRAGGYPGILQYEAQFRQFEHIDSLAFCRYRVALPVSIDLGLCSRGTKLPGSVLEGLGLIAKLIPFTRSCKIFVCKHAPSVLDIEDACTPDDCRS